MEKRGYNTNNMTVPWGEKFKLEKYVEHILRIQEWDIDSFYWEEDWFIHELTFKLMHKNDFSNRIGSHGVEGANGRKRDVMMAER